MAIAEVTGKDIFAAYHRYRGDKRITAYPFNDHEGGGARRWPELAEFVAEAM